MKMFSAKSKPLNLVRLATTALLLSVIPTAITMGQSHAVPVEICWSWDMDGKASGTFLTDGTLNVDGTANAGTYTLSDFKVDSSIYPSVEQGSISNGTYAFGFQPPYAFIWDGTAPTTFQRGSGFGFYTNGLPIFNGANNSGAYIGFGINYSEIRDDAYGTSRHSSSNTISLTPTTRANCNNPAGNTSTVYVEPVPVPYLKAVTAPKLNLKDGKLICTAGTYQTGYTFGSDVPTGGPSNFAPNNYIYNLLVNGTTQAPLTITSATTSSSWVPLQTFAGSTLSCAVTISANSLTITNRSTDNTDGLSQALSTQSAATSVAGETYLALLIANSKAYQKALVDNRAKWRSEIETIRAGYYDKLVSIQSSNKMLKIVTDRTAALKSMITAQKKSAADYKASQPAALAAKEAANQAALEAKNAAIAKANATFGTFIESIGYGVLAP